MKYKWFVGIDVSKLTLDVRLFVLEQGERSPHKQLTNEEKGFYSMISWLEKQGVDPKKVLFCMEHRGIQP